MTLTQIIECKRSRRTVEPCLDKGTPYLAENILSSQITFTDSHNSRVDITATVISFDGHFSDKEVHILVDGEGGNKLRI